MTDGQYALLEVLGETDTTRRTGWTPAVIATRKAAFPLELYA
ncbi:hypothetical protein STENM223S_07136 [Streptomyces tendae]